MAFVGCGTLSVDLTERTPAANSVPTSSGGNNAWVMTASIAVAPADCSAFAQAATVAPEDTMSSTSSAGRLARRAGSGKVDLDRAVAAAALARDRVIKPEPGREIAHPRPRFLVRADNNRLMVDVRAQHLGDRRHGRKVVSLDTRKDIANVGGAVQMRVDRHDTVKAAR